MLSRLTHAPLLCVLLLSLMCTQMMMTMLLCLTVLVGTNGELWRLMSMVKISAQLPVALGVVVSISHFVLLPIGE
jgi:hypothetical protein